MLREQRFLLACSGGLDSVVLAYLCAASNLDFAIAHCNFQLRGEDSEGDEKFVNNLAHSLNKKCYITHFNTNDYIKKHKVSMQMAARELRYTWFSVIMAKKELKILVTAHHVDDALETFLINLSRGTGIDGLTGIPARTSTLARPLLAFSREDIIAYAKSHRIEWREDSSNSETKYLRNKIRHEIVPALKELHPTFLENFKQTLSHLADTAALVENYVAHLKANIFKKEGRITMINIEKLQLHPQKAILYSLFKDYGFTAWDDIAHLLTASSGKEVRSHTHRLVKDRENLMLERLDSPDYSVYEIQEGQGEIQQPIPLKIEGVPSMGELVEDVLYLDQETLKYPLLVRKWEKGDYFYPLGMKGKKKLSKYFKDEKVDVISKENQWLLCSDGAIVWVMGRRADDRFKVTDKTNKIIKIELN